jgi:hypothetical protein
MKERKKRKREINRKMTRPDRPILNPNGQPHNKQKGEHTS